MTTLKPCPFCGIEISYNMVKRVIIHPSIGNCILSEMSFYSFKDILVGLWNTRAVTEDRELLIELSKPNISFDDLCSEAYVSNTFNYGDTLLMLNSAIVFTERDTKEGAEARIALRIRKHLEENP
jgi:hypothetical protein